MVFTTILKDKKIQKDRNGKLSTWKDLQNYSSLSCDKTWAPAKTWAGVKMSTKQLRLISPFLNSKFMGHLDIIFIGDIYLEVLLYVCNKKQTFSLTKLKPLKIDHRSLHT